MVDYTKARINMVDCQLRTNGITTPAVLDCFSIVPREVFLSGEIKKNAYVDDDLPLPGGFLMEPLVFARMIEAVKPVSTDTVLSIGDITGYASAVLARLTAKVVALEAKAGVLRVAQVQWSSLGCGNITTAAGEAGNGCPSHAPFSLIVINGAAESVPENLLDQLATGGRLAVVLRPRGQKAGEVTLFEKDAAGVYSRRSLFDAAVPYLPGLEPASAFQF
jgi:protein-L-isoaspartate(D-aspartate) O-methyltransferase